MDMNIEQNRRRKKNVASSVTDIKKSALKRRTYIPRSTRKFQLRVGERYPVDAHVAEILDYKRKQRSEVTTIRDGVRLLWALENNDLSVLFEMFPHLKEKLEPPPTDDGAGRLEKIESMLEIALANQKANNGYTMASQPPLPGLQPMTPTTGKQLASPAFALPVFDEDDELPTLKLARGKQNAADNLLQQLSGLH